MRAALLALAAGCRFGFDATTATTDGDARLGDGSNGGPDAASINSDAILPSTWELAANQPSTTEQLWGVIAFASTDVWIAGSGPTLQHYNGSWMPSPNPATDTLFVLWGLASNDLWVVGRGCTALRWLGTSWATPVTPSCSGSVELLAAHGTASSNLWISGTSGTLWQFTASWADHSQTNEDFWDVWTSSPTDAYIVGTRGTLLHYNGSTFTQTSSTPNVTLAQVWGSGTGEYWVVGGNGTILYKAGAADWVQVTSPTTQFLYAVEGTAANDVWAVGTGGVILHYDGGSWQQVASPTVKTLRNLAVIPGGGLVAVGDGGTVVLRP